MQLQQVVSETSIYWRVASFTHGNERGAAVRDTFGEALDVFKTMRSDAAEVDGINYRLEGMYWSDA